MQYVQVIEKKTVRGRSSRRNLILLAGVREAVMLVVLCAADSLAVPPVPLHFFLSNITSQFFFDVKSVRC